LWCPSGIILHVIVIDLIARGGELSIVLLFLLFLFDMNLTKDFRSQLTTHNVEKMIPCGIIDGFGMGSVMGE